MPQRVGTFSSGLGLLAQPLEVVCVHEREQPSLKGGGELKRKPKDLTDLGNRSGTSLDTYTNRWNKLLLPRVKRVKS